jgi:sugar lactone lactonase YvrE
VLFAIGRTSPVSACPYSPAQFVRRRQLPEGQRPDGLDIAADGRLFIATVISHGITVVSSEGEVLDVIVLDNQALPTNCCFDDNALWVTDFGVDWRQGAPIGRLWRIETDAVGRPQYRGRL